MDILRTADEAYAAHSVSVAVHSALSGIDKALIISQPQVVVGAEVDHFLAGLYFNGGTLRRGDNALLLIQAVLFDLIYFLCEERLHRFEHIYEL